MGIVIENVSKQFGSFQAVSQVNLTIESGTLVALLGPSGSGKSTLLRLISGLEVPDSGRILLTGEDATYRSVQDRNIGFVFQHYALFKHLTVRKNIAFALELRKTPKAKIKARVQELLQLIQLEGLGDRYPSQLSGGQRQRVALARSLAVEPKVLLLDEPFGALDAKVRKDLRAWLRRLHDEVHVTTVFVTHDQEEAMEVADEVVLMNRGKVEQVGTPAQVYDHPASAFVMSFIGPVNVLPGTSRLFEGNKLEGNRSGDNKFGDDKFGDDKFGDSNLEANFGAAAPQVFLRPQDVLIERTADPSSVPARVERVIHLGWEIQAELALEDGQVLTAHLTRDRFDELKLEPQQQVFVKSKEAKFFPLDYSI